MSDFFKKTNKFDKLILMYKNMAENGYKRRNGEFIPSEKVYGDLEPARHKNYFFTRREKKRPRLPLPLCPTEQEGELVHLL